MREIKFRAFYETTGEMFNVDVLALSECGWDCPDHGKRGVSIPYQPSIKVMQYTGVKDRNGTEIYEGDIVARYYEGDDVEEVGTACWVGGECDDDIDEYNIVTFEEGAFVWDNASIGDWYNKELFIIGNIHQDMQLLNVQKQKGSSDGI